MVSEALQAAKTEESSELDPPGHPQSVLSKACDLQPKQKSKLDEPTGPIKSKKKHAQGLEPITESRSSKESVSEFLSVRARLGLAIDEALSSGNNVCSISLVL